MNLHVKIFKLSNWITFTHLFFLNAFMGSYWQNKHDYIWLQSHFEKSYYVRGSWRNLKRRYVDTTKIFFHITYQDPSLSTEHEG